MSVRIHELIPRYYERLSRDGLSVVDSAVSLAQSYQHSEVDDIHLAISALRHPFSYSLMLPYIVDTHFSADILNKLLIYSRQRPPTFRPSQDFLQTMSLANELADDTVPIDPFILLGGSLLKRGTAGLGIANDASLKTRAKLVSSIEVDPQKAGLSASELKQKEQSDIYATTDPQIIILRAAGMPAEKMAEQLGISYAEYQIRILKLAKAEIIKDRPETRIGRIAPADLSSKINDLVASGFTFKEVALILNIGGFAVRQVVKELAKTGELKPRSTSSFHHKNMLKRIADKKEN